VKKRDPKNNVKSYEKAEMGGDTYSVSSTHCWWIWVRILLFTQQKLLAHNWKDQNIPMWVNSRLDIMGISVENEQKTLGKERNS